MADGLYVSMCGAAARSDQLDAVADNLANAQTPGFKGARPAFETFLPASGARDKAYPAAVASAFDMRPGPIQRTDQPLDVLPDDGLFLSVATPQGSRAYTRDGRLAVSSNGVLVQGTLAVLDRQGLPIHVPPGTAPSVESDGSVRAGGAVVGQLGLFRLDGAMDRIGPSLLAPGQGGTAAPAEGGVHTGEIELGNASPLDGMVQLITAQRNFDASMQALQTYRTMDQRSADVGRIR